MNERERWLLELTRTELNGQADFDPKEPRFYYSGSKAHQGYYHLHWKQAESNGDTFYRDNHPLANGIIQNALDRTTETSTLVLDYTAHGAKISVLEPFVGQSGILELHKLTVSTFDTEEFLILVAQSDSGEVLDDDVCRKLLSLPATVQQGNNDSMDFGDLLDAEVEQRLGEVDTRNMKYFDEEVIKLDHWSDDLKQGLERELKELDKSIREAKKMASLAVSLKDKLEAQKEVKHFESSRNKKRRELFESQDNIDLQRDELIKQVERQMERKVNVEKVFGVNWVIN